MSDPLMEYAPEYDMPESPLASVAPDSPPVPESPPVTHELHAKAPDILKDLMFWKRKQLNVGLLVGTTAAWVAMQIYQYNFITLFSWVAMAFVVCIFFWGNIHRLLKKEAPDLSELEISEETARNTATQFRQRVEDGIRLMFHVSAEREWFVFAGVVAFLYLLSMVAKYFDLFTLCYIGLMVGMMIPVAYVKNQEKLRELGGKLRVKSKRMYRMIDEKLRKMKNKVAGKHEVIKEKKME